MKNVLVHQSQCTYMRYLYSLNTEVTSVHGVGTPVWKSLGHPGQELHLFVALLNVTCPLPTPVCVSCQGEAITSSCNQGKVNHSPKNKMKQEIDSIVRQSKTYIYFLNHFYFCGYQWCALGWCIINVFWWIHSQSAFAFHIYSHLFISSYFYHVYSYTKDTGSKVKHYHFQFNYIHLTCLRYHFNFIWINTSHFIFIGLPNIIVPNFDQITHTVTV